MGRNRSPSIILSCLILACIFSQSPKTSGIEIRGKYNYEIERGRNIKLQLKKNRVTARTNDDSGGGGIILDRPKISILSYRVRNTDPWIIQDELSCSTSLAGGRASHCDDVVELERAGPSPLRLGQGPDEEPEWTVPPNVTQIMAKCWSKTGPVQWDYEGNGVQ
jgi:hypothetical protein